MRLRPLLSAACLSPVSWPQLSNALETIATAADLRAIERSATVHALLVIRTNEGGKGDERPSPEELVLSAYPDLPDIETELEGLVTFGVVDMAVHDKTSVGNQWQLPKLPALVMYQDVPRLNPYTGELYRAATPADISLLKKPQKLKKMLKSAIPTQFVYELEANDATWTFLTQFVQEKAQEVETVVLLISKQRHASPMYRAVAAELSDQGLSFVFLSKDEEAAEEVMKLLQVEEVPALVVLKSMTDHVVSSAEKVKTYGALKSFVEPFATPKGSKRNTSKGSKTSEGKSKFIRFFSGSEFDELVLHSDVVWIIEFMDSQREQQDLDEKKWKKTLTQLHRKAGVVATGAVSCEKEVELCERYGGSGVRVFPLELTSANRLKRAEVLPQKFTTIDEAKETAVATIPDLTVPITSPAELNAFTALARENHAMPVVFFTTKETTPPMIKALPLSVPTQKIMVAVLHDAGEDLKKQFLVDASAKTALVCLVPNQVQSEGPTSGQFGIIAYKKTTMGPYTYPNLMQFLLQVLAQYPHPQDTRFTSEEVDVSSLDLTSAQSLVPYVTKENFGDLCGGSKICVIGFFEDHLDTVADPESRLATWWITLAHVAAQSAQRGEPFQFIWMNGKCQKDFAEAFGVGLFQMPTLAVYSPSKQRFATNVGIFDELSATAFLKSVLSGSRSTAPLVGVPELVDECLFDEIQGAALGAGDVTEDDGDIDDMLSEILSDEKQQRDELEKESELKQTKKGKKKRKAKKNKSKKRKKKAARDEL
uniref:Thioredoxin domain-containing protein n=1 Tax=Peronospora matthiolae TaxID=2874970 RepID=A0AAV1TZV2_9STRA